MLIELITENKKIIIIILILLAIITLSKFFTPQKDSTKIDNSEDYIYTYQQTNDSKLPYINVNSKEIKEINIKNLKLYLNLQNQKTGYMDYQYYQSKNIISLLLYQIDIEGNISTSTYNIDINQKKLLSDQELLQQFSLNEKDISNKLNTYIDEYYQYELEKKYIAPSCDFNCYKQTNKIDTSTEYILFIKENSLYAYKKIHTTSSFLYDTNNPFSLFEFKLT